MKANELKHLRLVWPCVSVSDVGNGERQAAAAAAAAVAVSVVEAEDVIPDAEFLTVVAAGLAVGDNCDVAGDN